MLAGMVFSAIIPRTDAASKPATAASPQQVRAANVAKEEVPVRLTRIDPTRNMKRFYTVAVEVTLFDDVACTRTYGRIGERGGRVMVGLYPTEAEAVAALGRIVRAKLTRGYRREN
jgi:predicted DNA-binding WGR domain protein